jgi:hypothetical protein
MTETEFIRLEIGIAREIVERMSIEELAEAIGTRAAQEAKNQLEPQDERRNGDD